VRLDPWQAIGLKQRLAARAVPVEEFAFNAQSVGRLASTLHLLMRDRLLALPDDEALLDELGRVRLREMSPGALRMDHDAGQHDDRAIALALAASALLEHVPSTGSVSSAAHVMLAQVLPGRDGGEPEHVTRSRRHLGLPMEGGRYYLSAT
jgi:hypothetical protein